jgi:hypothetical protein
MVDSPDPKDVERIKTQFAQVQSAYEAVLQSPAGARMMEHLRAIYINSICDPSHMTDSQLWHREGARSCVAYIDAMASNRIPPPDFPTSRVKKNV